MKTLKHLCFIGIAVLLASAMVSCDFVEKPDVPLSNIVGYTDDGTPLVSLKIKTGASRALTLTLARAGIDYYEVVFFDGAKYYRASWDYTKTGSIIIPAVNYSGANSAVLYGGRDEDKTLLAFGTLTNPNIANLVGNTIVFSMVALTTTVTEDGDTSSFKITGPTTPKDYTTTGILPKVKVNKAEYPVFKVPASADGGTNPAINATFTVANITDAAKMVVGPVVAPATTAGKVYYATVVADTQALISLPSVTNGTVTPAAGTGLTDGVFTITGINTGDNLGFAKVSIEIPVLAIANTPDANGVGPITWFIRGGMQNKALDLGSGSNSLGGAFLLGVGEVNGYLITTNWP
jgi:hypothetical protein